MGRAPRSSGRCSRKTDKALAWRDLSTPYNVVAAGIQDCKSLFLNAFQAQNSFRRHPAGHLSGSPEAFRKSAEKRDGDLEGRKRREFWLENEVENYLKIDMEMNMKKDYEMPRVSLRRVELEQGFMAASKEDIKDEKVNVTIERQEEDDREFTIKWD